MPKTPVNPEAERVLVAGALEYPGEIARLLSSVTPVDVHDVFLREVFTAAVVLAEGNKEPTLPLLAEKLPGRIADIVKLREATPLSVVEMDHLAEIVREDSRKRRLLDIAREVANRAYSDDSTVSEIMAYAESSLVSIGNVGGEKWVHNRDLLQQHVKTIRARKDEGGVVGVPSGFADLDTRLGGFTEGQLIFLAAVPKTGKTAWALHVALHCKTPCLFYTLEMMPEELADRELAAEGGVPVYQIRTGKLGAMDEARVRGAADALETIPLAFVSQSGMSVQDMRLTAREYQQKHGLGLIIVDQLDKIAEPRQGNESDTTRIGRVTAGLKNMARDLRVPVICLTQLLDKQVAGRKLPRPQHGDIRDSSHPDQDADVILYLWRPTLYWPASKKYQGVVEVIIARARSSAEGSVWVQWEPQYTKLADLARADWPDVREEE